MRALLLALACLMARSALGQEMPDAPFVPIPDWLRGMVNKQGERCVSCPLCQPIGPGALALTEAGDLILHDGGADLPVPPHALLDIGTAQDGLVWACIEGRGMPWANVKCLIPPEML